MKQQNGPCSNLRIRPSTSQTFIYIAIEGEIDVLT